MLPDTTKATTEASFLRSAALVVSEAIPLAQGAYFAGCTPDALLGALADPDIARAVDAEATRLRYSGELAGLKAAKLTDNMLDKLLATPEEEISTSLAMKLAELGLKFREKAAPEQKASANRGHIYVLKGNDPDPPHDPDATFTYIIDLRDEKPTRTIEHEDITDAE